MVDISLSVLNSALSQVLLSAKNSHNCGHMIICPKQWGILHIRYRDIPEPSALISQELKQFYGVLPEPGALISQNLTQLWTYDYLAKCSCKRRTHTMVDISLSALNSALSQSTVTKLPRACSLSPPPPPRHACNLSINMIELLTSTN
ncbi:hypothetical protein J6590_038228 [Homalodisca vitripennis]|nr:hypothetical protein J6590_038228 [Homalodisca vitripennis]